MGGGGGGGGTPEHDGKLAILIGCKAHGIAEDKGVLPEQREGDCAQGVGDHQAGGLARVV